MSTAEPVAPPASVGASSEVRTRLASGPSPGSTSSGAAGSGGATPTTACSTPTSSVGSAAAAAASAGPAEERIAVHPSVPVPGGAVPAGMSPSPIASPAALAYFAAHPRRPQVYFGDYLLLQTLGEGEFGKVKLGVHRVWGEEVAIKLIKREKIAAAEDREAEEAARRGAGHEASRISKVEREIQILRALRHPNIVHLNEVIQSERYIGIVLEYGSGGELFDYILAHKCLRERDACRLFAQLVSGVAYLHHKKIIHRDLKLENLLLDRNRNVIITDFGFANDFSARENDLMATSCGSPCYAAPELVVQDGLYVGAAVDVWSCGVILYAMLAGYLPFDDDPANPDGDNINLLYKYIMSTPLTFPDYVGPEPRSLLQRLLVPDPSQRATLDEVMAHPWLAPYRDLFSFSVQDLERAAIEQQERKRQSARQQMLYQHRLIEQQRQARQAAAAGITESVSLPVGVGTGASAAAPAAPAAAPAAAREEPVKRKHQEERPAQPSTPLTPKENLPEGARDDKAKVGRQDSTGSSKSRRLLSGGVSPTDANLLSMAPVRRSGSDASRRSVPSRSDSSASRRAATAAGAAREAAAGAPVATTPVAAPPPVTPAKEGAEGAAEAAPAAVAPAAAPAAEAKPAEAKPAAAAQAAAAQAAAAAPATPHAIPSLTGATFPGAAPRATADAAERGALPPSTSAGPGTAIPASTSLPTAFGQAPPSITSLLPQRLADKRPSEFEPERARVQPESRSRPSSRPSSALGAGKPLPPTEPRAKCASLEAARPSLEVPSGRRPRPMSMPVPPTVGESTVPTAPGRVSVDEPEREAWVSEMPPRSSSSSHWLFEKLPGARPPPQRHTASPAKRIMGWLRRRSGQAPSGAVASGSTLATVPEGTAEERPRPSVVLSRPEEEEPVRRRPRPRPVSELVGAAPPTSVTFAETTKDRGSRRHSAYVAAPAREEADRRKSLSDAPTAVPRRDRMDLALNVHVGAVDQSALTVRAPEEVFQEVLQALHSMGIAVRTVGGSPYRVECVRAKRATGATPGTGGALRNLLAGRARDGEEGRSRWSRLGRAGSRRAGTTGRPSSNLFSRLSLSGERPSAAELEQGMGRMSLGQRPEPPSRVSMDEGELVPGRDMLPLYGDRMQDGGHEVRFSVEITRIATLRGLYSVDIRRLHGNMWSYKFLYTALLDRLELGGSFA